jgi:DNA-binding transcriptional regulator/RsmH inhibitor MraZ
MAMPVDLEPCAGVWRPQEYQRYTERALAELPPLSPRLSELERFFYGSSQDAELTPPGGSWSPASSPSTPGCDVVVVGAGDRLELWDRGRWNEHRPTLLGGVAEITARVDHPA